MRRNDEKAYPKDYLQFPSAGGLRFTQPPQLPPTDGEDYDIGKRDKDQYVERHNPFPCLLSSGLELVLDLFEMLLPHEANRADPVIREVFEGGSRRYAAVGIAFFRIIDVFAGKTLPFLHGVSRFHKRSRLGPAPCPGGGNGEAPLTTPLPGRNVEMWKWRKKIGSRGKGQTQGKLER